MKATLIIGLVLVTGCTMLPKHDTDSVPEYWTRWSAGQPYAHILETYSKEGNRIETAKALRAYAASETNRYAQPYTNMFMEVARQLEVMAQEDLRHNEGVHWSNPNLQSNDELIEKNIYWLREVQHEPAMADEYDTAIFDAPYDMRPNAAKMLKALGRDNIPRLIEMLNDDRLTRCIANWRMHVPLSWFLLRNKDVAISILNTYRDAPFYTPSCSGAYFSVEPTEIQERVIESVKRWNNNIQMPNHGLQPTLDPGRNREAK